MEDSEFLTTKYDPWNFTLPNVDLSSLQLIAKTRETRDNYFTTRVYLRNPSLADNMQHDLHIGSVDVELEFEEGDDDQDKSVYVAAFYNGLVNTLHFDNDEEYLDLVAKQNWAPKRFLLPVLRAFIKDHVVAQGFVSLSSEITIVACATSHPKHRKSKLPLIEYYQKMGFEPTTGYVTRSRTCSALSMTCPSINHFFRQTKSLVHQWHVPGFPGLAAWFQGPNKHTAFVQTLIPVLQ